MGCKVNKSQDKIEINYRNIGLCPSLHYHLSSNICARSELRFFKRQKNENNIIIYRDEDGVTKVSVKFRDEDIWLTQKQIAEIYKTTQ